MNGVPLDRLKELWNLTLAPRNERVFEDAMYLCSIYVPSLLDLINYHHPARVPWLPTCKRKECPMVGPNIHVDISYNLMPPAVRLGNSGLKVSKIILGCMSYGSPEWQDWVLPEEESIQHIKAA